LKGKKKGKKGGGKGGQWADHLTERAKSQGYPARSIYKLEEIQDKFKIIRKGDTVLDLGCAPGSWMLYAAKQVGDTGRVFGMESCRTDSSPDTYRHFLPALDRIDKTWSMRVDLPIPGSPPMRMREPSTIPPPRTRSNSATPVRIRRDSVTSTESIGTGFAAKAGRPFPALPGAATTGFSSTRQSQSPHSGHWPIHLGLCPPQDLHRYNILSFFFATRPCLTLIHL